MKRILVIEDDRELAQVVADVLEAGGYEALVAGNGREALEQLREGARPDLILLDMTMPVMDGWEFRREQQKRPEIAAIPVIVLTADGDAPRKAASVNAKSHLHKPVSMDALLNEVDRLCGSPE